MEVLPEAMLFNLRITFMAMDSSNPTNHNSYVKLKSQKDPVQSAMLKAQEAQEFHKIKKSQNKT